MKKAVIMICSVCYRLKKHGKWISPLSNKEWIAVYRDYAVKRKKGKCPEHKEVKKK